MNEIISKKNHFYVKNLRLYQTIAIGAAGGLEMSQSYNL